MHEYSIVQALLETVEREASARHASRVHRVYVSIGEVAGVEIDLLRTAYDTIRHRTVCHDATLEVRRVRARWECTSCGASLEARQPLHCPSCGARARLSSGDEIMLDRIEMEAA